MKVLTSSERTEAHLIKNAYQGIKTEYKSKQMAETRFVCNKRRGKHYTMQTHPAQRIRRETSRQRHRSTKPPKTKYQASERHSTRPSIDEQDQGVEV